MQDARLDESQGGIKIAGENVNNLRYMDDTTLMAESEEVKSLLIKVKEENEKASLKFNIQETKIMASGPITSWQIEGEKVETVTYFIFLHSKISADGNCSHELKRYLLLGIKAMKNLDIILKNRHNYAKKCVYSQSYFPVVIFRYENWTINKAEHQRTNAFKLWCWRILLKRFLVLQDQTS